MKTDAVFITPEAVLVEQNFQELEKKWAQPLYIWSNQYFNFSAASSPNNNKQIKNNTNGRVRVSPSPNMLIIMISSLFHRSRNHTKQCNNHVPQLQQRGDRKWWTKHKNNHHNIQNISLNVERNEIPDRKACSKVLTKTKTTQINKSREKKKNRNLQSWLSWK